MNFGVEVYEAQRVRGEGLLDTEILSLEEILVFT